MKKKIAIFKFLFLLITILIFTTKILYAVPYDFNSGSTGTNGAFPPSTVPIGANEITINLNNGEITFLPNGSVEILKNTPIGGFVDGVLSFTSVNIPLNITVRFIKHLNNTPVILLAQDAITVDGTLDISGENGETFKIDAGVGVSSGGEGGPGGFDGGDSGSISLSSQLGSAGLGIGGGRPGYSGIRTGGGMYGTSALFVSLIPLFGGSGGGGGLAHSNHTGTGGGGGGGAILMASSTTITVNGTIDANGGKGGDCLIAGHAFVNGYFGGGSGGAIRLVAENITGDGSLQVLGGGNCDGKYALEGGDGKVRVEAFDLSFSGPVWPPIAASHTFAIGPVSATSTPPMNNLPTLKITSIGGSSVPAVVNGVRHTPDIILPQNLQNPMEIIITTTKIPTGITFNVRMTPHIGLSTLTVSSPSVETADPNDDASTSVATAQISFPVGEVAILSVWTDFTIQTASLYPLIDGEMVERVMVASNLGGNSHVTFVTESGRYVSEKEMQLRMLLANN